MSDYGSASGSAAQPNIDGANITSGTISNARLDGLYYTNISNLWSNASNQDGRIVALEALPVRPAQPNIDAANVTSGVFGSERMPAGWVNKTYGDTLYEPLDSMFIKAEDIARFVNRTDWTTIDSYPTGCGLGTAVGTIGDTLTCLTVLNKTLADATYQPIDTSVAANFTALFANATGQEARLVQLQGNVSSAATNISLLWTNASNQQAQLWQKNTSALWIRFP